METKDLKSIPQVGIELECLHCEYTRKILEKGVDDLEPSKKGEYWALAETHHRETGHIVQVFFNEGSVHAYYIVGMPKGSSVNIQPVETKNPNEDSHDPDAPVEIDKENV